MNIALRIYIAVNYAVNYAFSGEKSSKMFAGMKKKSYLCIRIW